MNKTYKHIDSLGVAWEIHCYGFASAFLVITLVSTGLIIYLLCTRHKKKYPTLVYYSALIVCMVLLGLSRTLSMFIDPYGVHSYTHPIINEINMNLANAFLASAIYMLLILLVRLTKMKVLSRKLLGPYALIGIVILNVSVSVIADVITGLYHHLDFFGIICVSYFLIWGASCCIVFIYINYKFYALIYVNRKNLHLQNSVRSVSSNSTSTQLAMTPSGCNNSENSEGNIKVEIRPKMPYAMKVSIVIFVIFVIHLVTMVYGLLTVTMLKDRPRHHGPWPWWTIHMVKRATELAFAIAILCVSFRVIRSGSNK